MNDAKEAGARKTCGMKEEIEESGTPDEKWQSGDDADVKELRGSGLQDESRLAAVVAMI